MPRPVADVLLDVLRAWDVRHIFTCPGSTEAAVLDALVVRDDVELVLTTHEGVTVSIADGLSRATRLPSVAYLHANVGLTNGLSNLYAAQLAYSPVVVLNGLKASSIQSRGGFTTGRRMRDLVHQYVKSDWQSLTAEGIPEDVNRAFRTALTEPAGPVWVGLSQDLAEQQIEAAVPLADGYRFDSRTAPSPAALAAAAKLIADARRPVLVAGSELARVGAIDALVALSEKLGVPVLHEDRRGLERPGFPTDHPNFHGQYIPQHPLVRDADLLVFLGARLFNEFEQARVPQLPPGARVIHSHTDPQHVAAIHGVDVGLVGDQRLLIEALLNTVPLPVEPRDVPAYSPEPRSAPTRTVGGGLRPADVVDVVTEALRGVALVGDATTAGGVLQQRAEQRTGDDYFVSTSGSLGWGMGAALGVKLGMPHRQVAAILGDGVFQFGMPALWTAARRNIPVTYVVLNNERYAAVGAALRRFGGHAVRQNQWPGTDIAGPNIADISTGFGVPGQRVDSLADLRERLDAARRLDHPTLIEVMTASDDFGP
ncbi:thiamine pyrophosphate-binding protein [Plantactinospora sp. S1510]|uniref:Thiamine pyrophosphate-binding protein n=1 Tax=Plantactinospora alkalitolerans TaxID=2789879 RepID=A0ABS0GU56_9ACTN|nr:thiamine pyrophosphate-binding protein [Plantactinospora alkalitolerans]MBF9129730.1 thiamine pyrophosphate-binding protein [Plantactinospora alkalitolerans]